MAKTKNNKLILIVVGIVVAVILLGLGAYFVFASPAKKDDWQPQASNEATQGTQSAMNTDSTAQSKSMAKGSYQVYEPSKLALANEGQVVLFFNAKWCPDCQRANSNFQKEPIPDGITILSVDYDKYTDLKKKYGVTYQHTFVQVDSSGKQIKKWSASYTVADVEKNIQK